MGNAPTISTLTEWRVYFFSSGPYFWWLGMESHHRRPDLQSGALLAELPSRLGTPSQIRTDTLTVSKTVSSTNWDMGAQSAYVESIDNIRSRH